MKKFTQWLETLDRKPEDILGNFDYHDGFKNLYPGYQGDDSEYGDDYYFPSQKDAHGAAQEILDTFRSLPDPIPIFRAIHAASAEHIRLDDMAGESWSFDKDSAIRFGSHNGSNFLLFGFLAKNDADWDKTLEMYAHNSYANYQEPENEIVVPYPEKIKKLAYEPIKWKKRKSD